MSKKTFDKFIEKANLIHENKYDYSNVEYVNAHTPIDIICKKHGLFKQRPYAHTNQKQGCPHCGLENRKLPNHKTTQEFILEAKSKWGNLYDYSNTVYVNKQTKLSYKCLKHGEILQLPFLHLKSGCNFCNGRGINRHSFDTFKVLANEIHKNKYEYILDNDVFKITKEIRIICKKHGEFKQRADNHVHLKNGCPKCAKEISSSQAELDIIEYIKSISNKEIIRNDRNLLDGLEIDIFIPDLGLGIEYHGIWFHLETIYGKKKHYEKWKRAFGKNIRLLQIYDNEWIHKQEIVKSKILNLFNQSEKIYARKCKIVILDKQIKHEFLVKNHIQGSDNSNIAFGLEYDGELVCCMTFSGSRFNKNYDYELVRFCCKRSVSVVGGASRLLSYFRKNYSGSIVSYADKRWSDGNLYHQLGFKLDGETKPSFSYYKLSNKNLYSRLSFQKHKIEKMQGFDPLLTEYENMLKMGYDRIWDCGQYRFVS